MSGAAPIVVGVLGDRPGPEGPMIGEIRRVVDAAVASGRLDRPVTFVTEITEGLPEGTAANVTAGFHRLAAQDVLIIMGPTVTDNGLVATELADAHRIPCCNWTGSDRTRSEWMFHYQIGSLEEEPYLLADHLAFLGHKRVALIQDRSPIGNRYGSFFIDAIARHGIQLTARSLISPVATDLSTTVREVQRDIDALVYLGLGLSAGTLGHALTDAGWHPPVFANSALMFGYANPEWVSHWEGWTYVDAWSEQNPRLQALLAERPGVFPMTVAAGDDLGRLLVEGLAGAEILTREAVKESLERVKCLPATLGEPGTTLGFGYWDRAALKGGFILLRRWVGGRSVAVL
jgi:ABC-type branched-subunit amino acid transport system substrate-binding protein